jgi:hypothetical protein
MTFSKSADLFFYESFAWPAIGSKPTAAKKPNPRSGFFPIQGVGFEPMPNWMSLTSVFDLRGHDGFKEYGFILSRVLRLARHRLKADGC